MSIVSFVNPELDAEITTFIDKDRKIWFKARDVALALGYANPREAIRDHVRDKYKTTCRSLQGGSKSLLRSRGGFQTQTVFIQEPGLYQLIFSSKLPFAIEFLDWVFEEVIPIHQKYWDLHASMCTDNHKKYHLRRSDSVRRRRAKEVQTNS